MSLDQPSRAFADKDIAYCAQCAQMTSGRWIGDPTHPMSFLCECGFVTAGGDV